MNLLDAKWIIADLGLAGVLGILFTEIARVPATKFFIYNVVGGILWSDGVILLGYILGEKLKGSVDKYLLPIVGVIIVVSLLPLALEILKEIRTKRHLS